MLMFGSFVRLASVAVAAAALASCETPSTGGGSASPQTQAIVQGFVDAVLGRCIPAVMNDKPVQEISSERLPALEVAPANDVRRRGSDELYLVPGTGQNIAVYETEESCNIEGFGIPSKLAESALVPGLTQYTYDFLERETPKRPGGGLLRSFSKDVDGARVLVFMTGRDPGPNGPRFALVTVRVSKTQVDGGS